MVRLFVRLFILMLGTMAIAFTAEWYAFPVIEGMLPLKETGTQAAFAAVEGRLAQLPQAEWASEIERMRRTATTFRPLTTVDAVLARGRHPAWQAAELRQGVDILWINPEDNSVDLIKRVGQTPYALEIVLADPIPRQHIWWLESELIELIIIGTAMWLWVRPLWRDICRLNEATHHLSQGEFDHRVHLHKHSVLHGLGESLNWMAERIGALIASHKALTNAVSHELRTPLARLRFAQSLAAEDATLEGKDRQLARMLRDMDELDALSGELLTLAKLERIHAGSMESEAFPADEWLHDRVADAKDTAQALGRQLTISGQARLETLRGSVHYLSRALDNLLGNAIRHGHSRVEVAVEQGEGHALITVDDDGPGIPDADRVRVFEPFVRLEESRNRAWGGAGLGLSIVHHIARAHGGEVAVTDSPLGGARLAIMLPL